MWSRNGGWRCSFIPRNDSPKGFEVNTVTHEDDKKVPPAVLSREPEEELEERLKKHPQDEDAKADVGSDESMDASDPPAASQPSRHDEPVPSSGFPEDDEG
jgi:hypothetical protein